MKIASDRREFLRQIESNNDRSSTPPNHNDGHPGIGVHPDPLPARSPSAFETSTPSSTLPATHADGVVASGESESPTNPMNRVPRRPGVDTLPMLSSSRDGAHVEDPAALTKAPKSSEEAVRKLLCLRSRDEMATWLSQDWVADAFIEYYNMAIDHWRTAMEAIEAAGGEIPPQDRRSSEKFLVGRAADALRSRNPRYVAPSIAESYWTKDDQDIRFLVRIVDAGRASGRCWERYTRGDHTEYLCTVAYRLMCWLRAMHKITVATSGMSRWKKANCDGWFNILRGIRGQRAGSREAATAGAPLTDSVVEASHADTPQHRDPSHGQAPSPQSHTGDGDVVDMRLWPTRSPGVSDDRPGTRVDVTATFSGDVTSDSAQANLPDVTGSECSSDSPNEGWSREQPSGAPLDDSPRVDARSVRGLDGRDGPDLIAADSATLDTVPVELEPGRSEIERSIQRGNPSQLPSEFGYPTVAPYAALRSRKGMNQMKAIEWMLETGKDRFEAHQDQILGRWGLTAEHAGTCILIPASWSGLDPQDLVDDFSYEKCPSCGNGSRLVCLNLRQRYGN